MRPPWSVGQNVFLDRAKRVEFLSVKSLLKPFNLVALVSFTAAFNGRCSSYRFINIDIRSVQFIVVGWHFMRKTPQEN